MAYPKALADSRPQHDRWARSRRTRWTLAPGAPPRRTLGAAARLLAVAGSLASILLAGAALSAGPGADDGVVVLDAGTFVVVEARQAPLGDVLAKLGAQLGVSVSDTERVDLSRVIDGRRTGTVFEIMRWLVPDRSFVLIYKDRAPGDTRPAKLERIGFLSARDGSRASAPEPGSAVARADAAPPRGPGALTGASGQPDRRTRNAIAGTGSDMLRDRASGKPETPHTPKSEIKSVAEQLSAATPAAQMAIERDARAPDRQGPPPEFLRPHGDVAQTTLQQQMQRSQALAVEQLRALMEAYKAACQAKGTGPC